MQKVRLQNVVVQNVSPLRLVLPGQFKISASIGGPIFRCLSSKEETMLSRWASMFGDIYEVGSFRLSET